MSLLSDKSPLIQSAGKKINIGIFLFAVTAICFSIFIVIINFFELYPLMPVLMTLGYVIGYRNIRNVKNDKHFLSKLCPAQFKVYTSVVIHIQNFILMLLAYGDCNCDHIVFLFFSFPTFHLF